MKLERYQKTGSKKGHFGNGESKQKQNENQGPVWDPWYVQMLLLLPCQDGDIILRTTPTGIPDISTKFFFRYDVIE